MDTYELYARLAGVFGPSGQESEIADTIKELAAPYADDVRVDTLGNLIVHRSGNGPRLMLCAHMDSIGLIVTYFEEDGTLRFRNLGGVHPEEIRNAPVRFKNGAVGAVKVHGKADENRLTLDDLYLDMGAAGREEAQALARLGDAAVFANTPVKTGNRIIGPYLDDRIACAVLLQVLEQVKEPKYDLYFVFSVQEELGMRGAKTAAYAIDPDYAIAVDVTGSFDTPGCPKGGSAVLGGGAAVKVMDRSVICHPEMVKKLTDLAGEKGIKAQPDILSRGGTDAGAIHQSRSGVVTGGVSIPCRYAHTPTSVCDLADVEDCVALLAAFAESN